MLRCGDYLVEWVVKNTRTIEASIVVIALKKLLWNWDFSSFTDNFYIWWTWSWTRFIWNMKEEKLKYSFVTCFPRKEQIFNIWLMGLGKVSSKNNIFMTLTLTVGHLGNISFLTKTGEVGWVPQFGESSQKLWMFCGNLLLISLMKFGESSKNYGCFVETFS